MRKAIGRGVALVAFAVFSAGCGDLVSPGVQVVTDPPGAAVHLGEEKIGDSPVLIPLRRIKDHSLDTLTIVISKEGYATSRLVLNQRGGVLRVPLQKQ